MTKARKIAVIDCETDPFEKNVIPQPFIWGYYDGDNYEEFSETHELVEYIENRKEIIYAHNGGKFDFHYLLENANHNENIMVIAGRIVKFKIGQAELRDSFAIIPTALKQFEKQEFDYDKLHHTRRHLYQKEISDYLYSDCVNLFNMVSAFREEYGNGTTIAGTAMQYAEKLYNRKFTGSTQEFYATFKPYYAGGRVECLENGCIDAPIKLIDINSAYPHAMTFEHPIGQERIKLKEVREPNKSFISLECISNGAFFYKDKNKLTFPRDRVTREYHVTGWEYIKAKELGLIENEKIIEVHEFTETISFKEYVDHFFALRKLAKSQGDKAGDLFAKLFLNSLYGKFAANPDKYSEYQLTTWQCIANKEEMGYNIDAQVNELDYIISKPLDDWKKRWYNIATAASITGFVRAMIVDAQAKCDRPLYCDTDSVFFIGETQLELSKELGEWDMEGEFESMAIGGKKLYAARKEDKTYKTASKGVRLSGKEIYKVCRGEQVEYTPEAPTYSIKQGIYFNSRKITKTA